MIAIFAQHICENYISTIKHIIKLIVKKTKKKFVKFRIYKREMRQLNSQYFNICLIDLISLQQFNNLINLYVREMIANKNAIKFDFFISKKLIL